MINKVFTILLNHMNGFVFRKILITIVLSILFSSCKKIDEYFKPPETEYVKDVIKTAVSIGYSSEIAMSAISGYHRSNVRFIRSSSSYPCVGVIFVKPDADFPIPYSGNTKNEMSIFGFWTDENTAILSILFTSVDIQTSTFVLQSVHTVPVIRTDNNILVVFASMDINLAPESISDKLLSFNFSDNEINFEMSRILSFSQPEDLYVAVDENAWLIEINQQDTYDNPSDDVYSITGGGQLIEATNASAGVFQQAMMGVTINSECLKNPNTGFLLIQKAAVENEKFPETGAAILSFENSCDGKAYVDLGTGIYITSIGKKIDFLLTD